MPDATTFAKIAKITKPVTGIDCTIEEGHGSSMHLTETIARGETEAYKLEWLRIIPTGLKLWVRDKATGQVVRTVVMPEAAILQTLADLALDTL